MLFNSTRPGPSLSKTFRFSVREYATLLAVVKQRCSSFTLRHKSDSTDDDAELQAPLLSNMEKRRPDSGWDSERAAATAIYCGETASF